MTTVPVPFSAIQQTCLELLNSLFEEPPDELYHYTSGDGLRGILSNGHLRGSNFAFMNDRSEFTYGLGLLRDIGKRRLPEDAEEFDRRFYAALATLEPPISSDLYLTCFCRTGDLLSQWRGYGAQDSRYCIRFDPRALRGTHNTVSPVGPVIYEKDRQVRLLERIVDEHVSGMKLLRTMKMDPAAVMPMATWCIYTCALLAFAYFKDAAFEEEREWRSVLFVSPGEKVEELDFTNSGGVMKPFIPLIFGGDGQRLPITSVIAGASRSERQAVRSAELMLSKFGYLDVKVEPSRVPLAG